MLKTTGSLLLVTSRNRMDAKGIFPPIEYASRRTGAATVVVGGGQQEKIGRMSAFSMGFPVLP